MVKPTDQPLAAPEIARLAEDVDPRSVLPSPTRRETPEDYLSNINLDRLELPEDVAQLIDQVTKRVGGFDPAMRGKITQEQTSEFAAELGLTPERLLTRRTGQALNAEQLYAARALAQKSREEVADLAKRAVGGSDEDLLAFRKAWVRHVAIEEQVSGVAALPPLPCRTSPVTL